MGTFKLLACCVETPSNGFTEQPLIPNYLTEEQAVIVQQFLVVLGLMPVLKLFIYHTLPWIFISTQNWVRLYFKYSILK